MRLIAYNQFFTGSLVIGFFWVRKNLSSSVNNTNFGS